MFRLRLKNARYGLLTLRLLFLLHEKFFAIITPRSFWEFLVPSLVSAVLSVTVSFVDSTLLFSLFITIELSMLYFFIWVARILSSSFFFAMTWKSSAKSIDMFGVTGSGRSFTYNTKMSGPSIEYCGTPLVTALCDFRYN